MLSETQKSAQSPTASLLTNSVGGGPASGFSRQLSRSSSVSSGDEISNIPRAPPIPLTNSIAQRPPSISAIAPVRPMQSGTTTPVSDASIAESPVTSVRNTPVIPTPSRPLNPTQYSTVAPINPSISVTTKSFQPSTTNRVTTTGQNNLTRPNPTQTITSSQSKQPIPGIHGDISAGGKTNQSIFEKVDRHDGHTTVLGTGTFAQLESCIRNCLLQTKPHTSIINHTTKYNFPSKSLTRASVLEDYSYEGISLPKHHITHSSSYHHLDYPSSYHHLGHSSSYHHLDYPSSYHHLGHSSSYHHLDYPSRHCYTNNHTKSAALLSLSEIRQLNDSLSKCGIPVFSSYDYHHNYPNKPRTVGDIASACRLILEDSTNGSHRNGTHAVQHVWDAIQHYHPSTNTHGYASPAVKAVASHLFNPPYQAPYDPVHSVASHLLPHRQQSSYNPVQSVASHLFSGPSQHFTASPFSTTFHQYPGNSYSYY